MNSIFDFNSYIDYLTSFLAEKLNKGYGLKGKMARSLGVSSSFLSQVFSEEKVLTPEQATDFCDFLSLNEMESDYFHLLVQLKRAGTVRLRTRISKKLASAQLEAKKISTRVPKNKDLTNEQKAVYYSSWHYTGIRNLVAIHDFRNVENLANRLGLSKERTAEVVNFLLDHGLCIKVENELSYGPASIHIDKESPYVTQHHKNWRLKAMEVCDARNSGNLYFTSPMSLSMEAFELIQAKIPNIIQEVMKIVGPSKSEVVACLNIDLFKY